MTNLNRSQIGTGIYFTEIEGKKFKTMRLSANFIVPLAKESAFANALVPNILRRGGADYPSFQALNRKLDELYGAILYTDVRKSGDRQVLSLSVQTVSDAYTMGEESCELECARLLLSLLLHPACEGNSFRQSDFEVEKKGLVEQILSEMNDKRISAVRGAVAEMFKGDPHGLPVMGTVEDAQKVTPSDVFFAYRHLLETAEIEIVCCGNFSPDRLKKEFCTAMSELKRKSGESVSCLPLSSVDTPNTCIDQQQVLQSKLVLGFSAPTDDLAAARVAVALFGGTVTSKLFTNVREKMSLCYYCAARWDQSKKYMLVDSGVANDMIDKAKDEILRQLALMAGGDVSEQECAETLSYLRNGLLTVNDSLSGMEQWYLTRILLGDLLSPEELYETLSSVSPERIIRSASAFQLHTVYILKGVDGIEAEHN